MVKVDKFFIIFLIYVNTLENSYLWEHREYISFSNICLYDLWCRICNGRRNISTW